MEEKKLQELHSSISKILQPRQRVARMVDTFLHLPNDQAFGFLNMFDPQEIGEFFEEIQRRFRAIPNATKRREVISHLLSRLQGPSDSFSPLLRQFITSLTSEDREALLHYVLKQPASNYIKWYNSFEGKDQDRIFKQFQQQLEQQTPMESRHFLEVLPASLFSEIGDRLKEEKESKWKQILDRAEFEKRFHALVKKQDLDAIYKLIFETKTPQEMEYLADLISSTRNLPPQINERMKEEIQRYFCPHEDLQACSRELQTLLVDKFPLQDITLMPRLFQQCSKTPFETLARMMEMDPGQRVFANVHPGGTCYDVNEEWRVLVLRGLHEGIQDVTELWNEKSPVEGVTAFALFQQFLHKYTITFSAYAFLYWEFQRMIANYLQGRDSEPSPFVESLFRTNSFTSNDVQPYEDWRSEFRRTFREVSQQITHRDDYEKKHKQAYREKQAKNERDLQETTKELANIQRHLDQLPAEESTPESDKWGELKSKKIMERMMIENKLKGEPYPQRMKQFQANILGIATPFIQQTSMLLAGNRSASQAIPQKTPSEMKAAREYLRQHWADYSPVFSRFCDEKTKAKEQLKCLDEHDQDIQDILNDVFARGNDWKAHGVPYLKKLKNLRILEGCKPSLFYSPDQKQFIDFIQNDIDLENDDIYSLGARKCAKNPQLLAEDILRSFMAGSIRRGKGTDILQELDKKDIKTKYHVDVSRGSKVLRDALRPELSSSNDVVLKALLNKAKEIFGTQYMPNKMSPLDQFSDTQIFPVTPTHIIEWAHKHNDIVKRNGKMLSRWRNLIDRPHAIKAWEEALPEEQRKYPKPKALTAKDREEEKELTEKLKADLGEDSEYLIHVGGDAPKAQTIADLFRKYMFYPPE